jgi:hypothetical protein
MSAALAVTPASGAIEAIEDVVRIDVTGGDPEIRQRIKATKTGEDDLVSHEFQPSSDGKHSWFSIMFPAAGSWTLTLYNTANDETLATAAVTVI